MDMTVQLQNALGGRHVPLLAQLHARPVYGYDGKPLVVAGNNAVVGRVRRADGSNVAIRLPSDLELGRPSLIRHAALGAHLSSAPNERLPGGIRVINEALSISPEPGSDVLASIVTMEWIEGPTLLQAVDRAARGGNSGVLRALAAALIVAANALADGGLVHGDVNATNVIVRANGMICFVDLDTMTWTDAPLGSVPSGTTAIRHPAGALSPQLADHFSTLVLYASLAILSDEPDLRRSFGDPTGSPDGALLFSAWDLADPSTSRTFAEARARVGPERRTLIDAVASASMGDEAAVLAAVRLIPALRVTGLPDVGATSTNAWSLDSALNRIRARYSSPKPAAESTWDGSAASLDETVVVDALRAPDSALATWPTIPSGTADGDGRDQPVTDEDLAALRQAIGRSDDSEIAQIWARIGHDPAALLLAGEVEDVLAAAVCRRIESEARAGRDRVVLQLATEAAARRLPLTPSSRNAARSARERLDVRTELDRALAENDRQELTDLAVSGRLVVVGDADDESLRTVLRAIEYPALQRAIQADDDRLILAVYDDDLFANGRGLTAEQGARVQLARQRLAWLSSVRAAVKGRRVADLVQLFMDPVSGGVELLAIGERRRVRRMIQQKQALDELNTAIKGTDDAAIVAALNKVERVNARISDRFAWGSIQRVVERVSIIDELVQLAESAEPDYGRLAELIPAARALGLAHDPRMTGSVSLESLEARVFRLAHVRRLRAALSRDDDFSIMIAAVPDPHDALELLDEPERDRVAAAILARRRVDRDAVDARFT